MITQPRRRNGHAFHAARSQHSTSRPVVCCAATLDLLSLGDEPIGHAQPGRYHRNPVPTASYSQSLAELLLVSSLLQNWKRHKTWSRHHNQHNARILSWSVTPKGLHIDDDGASLVSSWHHLDYQCLGDVCGMRASQGTRQIDLQTMEVVYQA